MEDFASQGNELTMPGWDRDQYFRYTVLTNTQIGFFSYYCVVQIVHSVETLKCVCVAKGGVKDLNFYRAKVGTLNKDSKYQYKANPAKAAIMGERCQKLVFTNNSTTVSQLKEDKIAYILWTTIFAAGKLIFS